MPIDTAVATKIWNRYVWCRDNGHEDFIQKADKCDAFFRGDQWRREDIEKLRESRRPALTINKIISTMSTIMGEQIYNRSEIAFRPRGNSPAGIAEILTKVFKVIADDNQLDWLRSEMFADGIITSRGFLDVRLRFDDHAFGEIGLKTLNPKNVIIDPDAEHYDPDTWGEVFITKWLTADDIEVLYSKEDAELLRNEAGSFFPYGYDSIEFNRDRFGERFNPAYNSDRDDSNVMRSVRVIERQYRMLDRQLHFVDPSTGDMRPVPTSWDRNKIALVRDQFDLRVTRKLVRRIRWTAIADRVVLHDDWSPYKHFTVVPYFPFFRHGRTIGLVENLLGSQELLNKVSSQELHVINTTANSGWKVKSGALINMSIEELEQRGAETGLVVEVDDVKNIDKITSNQIPTGLDRVSFKAEEHIKTIANVPDSVQGQDRADVAAKAIQQKRMAASTNFVKPMDQLNRTDFLLARNMLDIFQEFYTDERVMTMTKDAVQGTTEQFTINQVTPEGLVLNDLTVGEYSVVTTSVPQRETLEDSQFEQAVSLRELNIPIPDDVLIETSRLHNKRQIIEKIAAASNSEQAQQDREIALRAAMADAGNKEASAQRALADARLKEAKVVKELQPEQGGQQGPTAVDVERVNIERERLEHEIDLDWAEFGLRRRETDIKYLQATRPQPRPQGAST